MARRSRSAGPKSKSKSGGVHSKNKGKAKSSQKPKTKKAPNNNPMTSSSAGSPTKQARQPRAPPWQVLSQKDAKKNVQLEKTRRERIQQGLPQQQETETLKEASISKAFLDPLDQSFLGWKRFNPSSTPSGMRFVASVLDKRMPPRLGVPEVAFLGRSNVGKSSLLNRLSSFSKREAGFTDQARVGKTPGATASVNLYAFYDKKGKKPLLGFVDLPGFGYAKLSKDTKESVQQTAETYLAKRSELVLGILLVDIRRLPSQDDRIVLAALYDMGVPIVVVATKVDKVSKNEVDQRLKDIQEGLGLPEGQPLCISSVTGEGTKALWNLIFEACETGVEEFKSKFERGGALEEEQDDGYLDEEPFDDDEDSYYSQGYDWVQDSYEEYASESFYDDEGEDDGVMEEEYEKEADDIAVYQESIKDLRKRARRLERDGGV